MSIVLKFSSILNVPLQNYCNDFTFVVNNQEFKTNRLIADLLSPKISQIHLNDPTCDRFIIHTQCKGDFSHILQLIKFNELSIPTNEIEFFNEIIEEFGYANFDITISEEPINFTIDNVFSHIKNYGKKNSFSKRRYQSAIEFISAHFTEVIDSHQEEMFQLEDDVLDDVLSHPKLKLNTEDELLSFLNELYQKDSKFSILYKHVIFENITSCCMKEFIGIFDYNDLDFPVWQVLSVRLQSELKDDKKSDNLKDRYKDKSIKTFLHDTNNEFNGIFNYLTSKTGGNIHDNGTIEVTSNSIQYDASYHPKHLTCLSQNNYFVNGSFSDEVWVCFDFKNMEIEITSYAIKSIQREKGCAHIKNWSIEISNDGEKWEKIDEHSNYAELNGPDIVKAFDVSPRIFARYCRFVHNNDYYGNLDYNLGLNSIEFYGKLKEQ